MRAVLLLACAAALVAAAHPRTALAAEDVPGPVRVPRASSAIVVDGALDEPAWEHAARIDRFYETNPGNNTPPKVRTAVYLTYDARYLYVAVACDDPSPASIRAPFVPRDQVLGDQDNIAILLDTRDDARTAIQLRANARGIQADAVNNDATGAEDFSPDFFYETAARITRRGWTVEFAIPFSTLRYPDGDPHTFGFTLIRNYPRDFRYQISTSPFPRGSNCFICHELKLTGLQGLPSGNHLTAAPYATARETGEAPSGTPGLPLVNGPAKGAAGLDVKWTANADTALDATVNPDFSQVESDVGQLTVNNRFAPFYPEKRPFFLEGLDLFDTPIRAVHTRTITAPRWGARATGEHGSSTYTAIVAEDAGGGSVLLPGATESSLAPQDFRSLVAIGRVRRDFRGSFAGVLFTDREIAGGGHNRVLGPDFQWRPRQSEQVTGQLLLSDTTEPQRPDLAPDWRGQHLVSRALDVAWNHSTPGWDWTARYQDVGAGFRADTGFVPQVGYRTGLLDIGYTRYPNRTISSFRPSLTVTYQAAPGGAVINRSVVPGLRVFGRLALQGFVELHPAEETRVGDRLLRTTFVAFNWQARPARFLPLVTLVGHLGQDLDVVNLRTGRGGEVSIGVTTRPGSHLQLDFNGDREWIDVADSVGTIGDGRLFTAQITRLKATWTFTARSFARAIGQYESVRRDPRLDLVPVSGRSAQFSGSLLYGYQVNWQTVLFVGYGDDRALPEAAPGQPSGAGRLAPVDREFFVKLSYAFQR